MTKKTMQQVAQMALDVQSASNLAAVVRSFAEAIDVLREQHDYTGTKWLAEHPVSVLFATQIGHLTKVAIIADDACNYDKAYRECKKMAAEGISLAAVREIARIDRAYDAADEARQERNLMSTKDIGYVTHEDKLRR